MITEGKIIYLTNGRYDDYHVTEILICMVAFDPDSELSLFKQTDGYMKEGQVWFPRHDYDMRFVDWLVSRKLVIVSTDNVELHI